VGNDNVFALKNPGVANEIRDALKRQRKLTLDCAQSLNPSEQGNGDGVLVGVGVRLFWPALLALPATGVG
jgi:hypothetical protein